jgi:hypothetical protein
MSDCEVQTTSGTARSYVRAAAIVAGLMIALGLPADLSAQGVVETGTYSDWILHQSDTPSGKSCFAASNPVQKLPAGANRGRVLLYVSAWPKDGVKSEVSAKLGYPINESSPLTATVGNEVFKLFAKGEHVFVLDQTQELKLIEAMKKGSKLVVNSTSKRGTNTIDTYSLIGLGRALKEMAAACP